MLNSQALRLNASCLPEKRNIPRVNWATQNKLPFNQLRDHCRALPSHSTLICKKSSAWDFLNFGGMFQDACISASFVDAKRGLWKSPRDYLYDARAIVFIAPEMKTFSRRDASIAHCVMNKNSRANLFFFRNPFCFSTHTILGNRSVSAEWMMVPF